MQGISKAAALAEFEEASNARKTGSSSSLGRSRMTTAASLSIDVGCGCLDQCSSCVGRRGRGYNGGGRDKREQKEDHHHIQYNALAEQEKRSVRQSWIWEEVVKKTTKQTHPTS